MKVEIIKSKRKTLAIEIKSDLHVIVRAPLRMSDRAIDAFVKSKQSWIDRHIAKMKSAAVKVGDKLSEAEIRRLTAEAKRVLIPKVKYFSDIMGVKYNRIAIRHQVSRWGSCSSKKNINLNCLLMLCPESVRDYVIIHELCHLKEMNHSKGFWAQVYKYCPDYKRELLWLKQNGGKLINKLK